MNNKDGNREDYSTNFNTISNALEEINKLLLDRSSMLKNAGIIFCYIYQERISDLDSKLSTFSLSEQIMAIKAKNGPIYELLKERGALLKKNYEERENLAKLLILISKVKDQDIKYKLAEALKKGEIKEIIHLRGRGKECDKELYEKIAAIFNRLGISASISADGGMLSSHPPVKGEVPFVIANKKVWVSAEAADKLLINISNIEKLSPHLQWKNAQKQIMELSENEEKEFAELQKKYLALLKEQDEILKGFKEEESLSVKVS